MRTAEQKAKRATYQKVWRRNNPEKIRQLDKSWRDRHPDRLKELAMEAYHRKLAFLRGVKTIGCKVCGLKDVRCLVFHHRDPTQKKFNIGCGQSRSYPALKEELKKCDVLCSNCHMILHAEEKQDAIK